MRKEIKRAVIDWWFSDEGMMTKSRAEIVEKTIELTLEESRKEPLRIYNKYKVSDTFKINRNNHDKFVSEMENFFCNMRKDTEDMEDDIK